MGPSAETALPLAHGDSVPTVCNEPESSSVVLSFLHLGQSGFTVAFPPPSSPLPASMASYPSSPSLVFVLCVLSVL